MNTKLKLISILMLSASVRAAEVLKPTMLTTDLLELTDVTWQHGYLTNVPLWEAASDTPLQYAPICSSSPLFSWNVPGGENDVKQLSYRIILSDNLEDIRQSKGNLWESGEISSAQSVAVPYEGEKLKGNTDYFWRVKVKTNRHGESDWSEVKAFRTADQPLPYAMSHYPQVKTRQHPQAVRLLENGSQLLDFGKAAFGQLLLTLTAYLPGESVTIHLGEALAGDKVDRKPGGTIRYHRYILPLQKGTHTYRIRIRKDSRNTGPNAIKMPDYIGEVMPFRYCELEGYTPQLKTEEAEREMVHTPFDDQAADFACSNDTLNAVWELSKYSIKGTSFAGVYVDGDRERIPYEADALINQLCHYCVDRDFSVARRTLFHLLEHPTWPTEWSLQTILIAWYDYLYTGDKRALEASYELLKQHTLLALREQNGLISTSTGLQTPDFLSTLRMKEKLRDIVDWPHSGILGLGKKEPGETDGFVFSDYNAVTNAYHYEALRLMGKIAQALQREEDALFYQKEAKDFLTRYNRFFFNSQKGLYTDGIDTVTHTALHSQMFPLAFGMVKEQNRPQVADFIKSRGMSCSVYGAFFLMNALYEANEADYALSLLAGTGQRSWYNMLRAGSTISMEAWDNVYKPNQDWNHAWGAAPAYVIPTRLMGIEPLTPAYAKARIAPQTAGLDWARCKVPTIRGSILVEVRKEAQAYELHVELPANMEGEVWLPLQGKNYRISMDNARCKYQTVKGRPFALIENVPSGVHVFRVEYLSGKR